MKMRRCADVVMAGCATCKRIFRVMDVAGGSKPGGWVWVGQDVEPDTHYWDTEKKAAFKMPDQTNPSAVFDYEQLAWVVDAGAAWVEVRARRDGLLAACDWRVLPDAPTPDDERAAWLEYRQALRDVTEQPDPCAIDWPTSPA